MIYADTRTPPDGGGTVRKWTTKAQTDECTEDRKRSVREKIRIIYINLISHSVLARLKPFAQSRTCFGVSEATPDLFRGSLFLRPSAELKRRRYFFAKGYHRKKSIYF